ncbi:RWD domain-containing protein 4 isoform X2 [Rhodnius prolixus]|uniref:RWD domain-containing protein 4 isoform X2 n=1 Tax=Rhodnius prolixus TaxID=13249 RepID=UPI003D187C7B
MDLQEEEREVILSIYEGDPAFNQLSPITYQYKYGTDGDPKSFLLEISWGENYPNDKPKVNMDTFYNKHILLQEAEQFLGGAMTYSLIEFIKEKYDELTAEDFSLTTFVEASSPVEETVIDKEETVIQTKLEKKVHLTKAQKRKQWDRVDNKGERPRGWNWVDIVHHLTQTGTKQPTTSDN